MDGTFNPENKITFEELAPSLQKMVKDCVAVSDFQALQNRVVTISNQIGPNRISIKSDLASIPNPQNSRELALNTTTGLMYGYQNAWIPAGGVYS